MREPKSIEFSQPPNPVDAATDLPIEEFITSFLPSSNWRSYTTATTPPTTLSLSLIASSNLTKNELLQCFDLIAQSSKPDYQSSILGWHPVKKKKEMKLLDLKYLLIRPSPPTSSSPSSTEFKPVQGFLSFMPTHEDSISCLYIYEIHLAPELRGSGLGRHLIGLMEGIAEEVGVEKVMLTCFVRNKGARSFYEKLGYVVEEVVEGRKLRGGKRDEVDESGYLIMGKDVGGDEKKEKDSLKGDGWQDIDSDEDACAGDSKTDSEMQKS